jgi:hypothetical protein
MSHFRILYGCWLGHCCVLRVGFVGFVSGLLDVPFVPVLSPLGTSDADVPNVLILSLFVART